MNVSGYLDRSLETIFEKKMYPINIQSLSGQVVNLDSCVFNGFLIVFVYLFVLPSHTVVRSNVSFGDFSK